MVFARFLFCAALCFAWPRTSAAQSTVSGRYLVEPVVGRFFSRDSEDALLFGARATRRHSYSRSYYAGIVYGRTAHTETFATPDSRSTTSRSSRYVLGSVGIGSTVVDRDATGNVGAHLLLGLGFVSSSMQIQWEYESPDSPFDRSELHHLRFGPLIDFAAIGEVELFSPRILLRVQAGAYLALNVNRERYEGLVWYPGASITAGIAAAF